MENSFKNMKSEVASEPLEELLAEARTYFRSRSGLHRLLDGLVEKYLCLGRMGGVIVLENVALQNGRHWKVSSGGGCLEQIFVFPSLALRKP